MKRAVSELYPVLTYTFRDSALLENALTHRSVGSYNNERLEYLGDSILNFIIASELFQCLPDAAEGDLSRMRANLVNKAALAEIANRLHLGDFLNLGAGELKSGGYRRDSILADALEAVFGAIFLDGGYESARTLIRKLYSVELDNLPDADALKDPKTRIQEYLQARGQPLPIYELINTRGKSHDQVFTIECSIENHDKKTQGVGASRRKAEQLAAQAMLEWLMSNKLK